MVPSLRVVMAFAALGGLPAQAATLSYGPLAPGWRAVAGSSESPGATAPGSGQLPLALGAVLHFSAGQTEAFAAAKGAGGVVSDVAFEQVPSLTSIAGAQRYLAGKEADEIPGLAETFKVTEARVGGRRVFRNMRGAAYGSHVYLIEVDAGRQLFVVCKSRIRVPALGANGASQQPGPIAARWAAQLEQLLATLRVDRVETLAAPVAAAAVAPPSPRPAVDPAATTPPPMIPVPAPPLTQAPAAPRALVGHATVVTGGRLPAVTVFNDDQVEWSGCTCIIPGRRTFKLKSLPPRFRREMPFSYFTPTPSAPDLRDAVLVRCTQGSGQFPARF